MLDLINDLLRRCVKRLFNNIKDECVSDIIAFGILFLIGLISISVSAIVENNKIAFGIIASIVIIIFSIGFFYKGKE